MAAGADADLPNPNLCPRWARESILRYVDDGIETGGFLRSVMENDLKASIFRADPLNLLAIPHIVAFLVQDISGGVWGSPERVAGHLRSKRVERAMAAGR